MCNEIVIHVYSTARFNCILVHVLIDSVQGQIPNLHCRYRKAAVRRFELSCSSERSSNCCHTSRLESQTMGNPSADGRQRVWKWNCNRLKNLGGHHKVMVVPVLLLPWCSYRCKCGCGCYAHRYPSSKCRSGCK